MAKRRSQYRTQWSQMSLNVTELDQNSECYDTHDPAWWRHLQTTARPSIASASSGTAFLSPGSRVSTSDLHDNWWENLNRTSINSTNRFSIRQSVNPPESHEQSLDSEDAENDSIKKRRVVFSQRNTHSDTTETFLKVLNNSTATAQSEPGPSKKRERARPHKNVRHTGSLIGQGNASFNSSRSSESVEEIVKVRPQFLKERKRTTQDSPDPYIKILKKNEKQNNSQIATPSNSGSKDLGNLLDHLMGPPKGTTSHRKRLSAAARDLIGSDSSDYETPQKKPRPAFAKKTKNNWSINPFDEILSSQSFQSQELEKQENKSPRMSTANTLNTSSHSNESGKNQSRNSSSSTLKSRVLRQTQHATFIEEFRDNQEANVSSSALKNISMNSIRRARSKNRSEILGNSITDNTQRQLLKDWDLSKSSSKDDDPKLSSTSLNVLKNPDLITKTLTVDVSRLTSPEISKFIEKTAKKFSREGEEENWPNASNRSLRSGRSRVLNETAYDLIDKNRSDTPIPSISENESETASPMRQSPRYNREKSFNRSVRDNETANTSGNSYTHSTDVRVSLQRIEIDNKRDGKKMLLRQSAFDSSDVEKRSAKGLSRTNITLPESAHQETTSLEETGFSSRRTSSRFVEKSRSRSRQGINYDESVSEETTRGEGRGVSIRNNSQESVSEATISLEEAPISSKSGKEDRKSYDRKSNSRRPIEFVENSGEEETETFEKFNSKIAEKSYESEMDRTENKSLRIESDQISEEETENKKSNSKLSDKTFRSTEEDRADAKITFRSQTESNSERTSDDDSEIFEPSRSKITEKSHKLSEKDRTVRKSIIVSSSKLRIESDRSTSEAGAETLNKSNSKVANASHESTRKSTLRKSTARSSQFRIESDKSMREEEPETLNKSISKVANTSQESTRKETLRKSTARSSQLRIESDKSISEEEPETLNKSISKVANASHESTRKGHSTLRKSTTRSSQFRIESDKSMREEEPETLNKSISKVANASHESTRKETLRKSTARSSQLQIESDKSISEEEPETLNKSISKVANASHESTRKSTLKKSTARSSQLRIESDKSISEEEPETLNKSISKVANTSHKSTRKGHSTLRKSIPRSSQLRIESDKSMSEEEPETLNKSNSKVANATYESTRKGHSTLRKTTAPSSSQLGIESDKTMSKEEPETLTKSNSKLSNESQESTRKDHSSLRKTTARPSQLRISSDESMSAVDLEIFEPPTSKLTEKSHKLSVQDNEVKKSISRLNTSQRRIDADKSMSEDESGVFNKSNSKLMTKSHKSSEANGTLKKSIARRILESDETTSDDKLEIETVRDAVENANMSETREKTKTKSNDTSLKSKSNTMTDITDGTENSSATTSGVPIATELSLSHNASKISNVNKVNAKQKNITEFFPQKSAQSRSIQELTGIDKEKIERIRQEVAKVRQEEAAAAKLAEANKKTLPLPKRSGIASKSNLPRALGSSSKQTKKSAKVVNKAYIVNGVVYKKPKLPRPKSWATDRLYRYLWKKMEPKFKISTRIKSERFVVQLAEVVALVRRRKKYDNYKDEVDALMREMARLGIIETRSDFYGFCYDFLPYEFREKVTPILLPGNVMSIPYDPELLDTPLLP